MIRSIRVALLLVSLWFLTAAVWARDTPSDYQDVLKSLDRKGDFKAGVLKVNIPRSDLKMTVQGVPTSTPFGFGGWIALTKASDGTDVMMGDLVLLQEEGNPVMSALLDNGIDVTGLHNHFSGTIRTCITCTCTEWAKRPILHIGCACACSVFVLWYRA